MRPLIGLAIGIFLGLTLNVSASNTKIFAVILMAALDSIFGGLCAKLNLRFSDAKLISGFIVNSLFAIILIWIGNIFAIELYYVALMVFGFRIFKNLSSIKGRLLNKFGF